MALGGTAALALAGFAGMAQVTGSAFADETSVGARSVNLTVANAPATLEISAPKVIKSVKVIEFDGPESINRGCYSITPGQAPVATGTTVSVGHQLMAVFFEAEQCVQEISGPSAGATVDTATDEFVFDLTKGFNNGG